MRIAFVTETYPPEINGVALTVARTVAYLRARGHHVDLIRPARPDSIASPWSAAASTCSASRRIGATAACAASGGGADAAPVLLHVGRLAAEKNVELALDAFRNARRFQPLARMIVVGDGPRRRALEREFPEARFVGVQTGDALAAHYASADLFVLPSLSETFGNVTLEALASGLPVIAFNAAAAAEHVRDRVNGRVVSPGNATAFVVATCLMVAGHRVLLPPMRVAARESVATLGWDSALGRFEDQLLDALDDAERTRPAAACAA